MEKCLTPDIMLHLVHRVIVTLYNS